MKLSNMLPGRASKDRTSSSSPSEDEKQVVADEKQVPHGELPPDPDSGLSEAERERIVSLRSHLQSLQFVSNQSTGPSPALEA